MIIFAIFRVLTFECGTLSRDADALINHAKRSRTDSCNGSQLEELRRKRVVYCSLFISKQKAKPPIRFVYLNYIKRSVLPEEERGSVFGTCALGEFDNRRTFICHQAA